MTTTSPATTALSVSDQLAHTLADPSAVWPGGRPAGGRAWPQSLAGGAAGITLLHVERARSGRGDWGTVHKWLGTALREDISAAANANIYFGAPALAFVTHLAATSSGRYLRVLERLDAATVTVTRDRLAMAHERIDRGDRPPMEEFDLVQGLAGLGAYHLSRHPEREITREILAYLVRLTEPLAGPVGLPPWWMEVAPSGVRHLDYPGGHGNFGLAHGIGSVLSVLSKALLSGLTVPGMTDAVARICAWTDNWRQGDRNSPWWPGQITVEQVADGRVHPDLRPRPSWCYGVGGTARAQQLAGLALGDPLRVQTAENALLAVLRDPLRLVELPEVGLCHGMAGLLHSAWRMSAETDSPEIGAELPHLTGRLISALDRSDYDPELLDGTAGVALALHAVGTGRAPAPHWDTFLATA